MVMPKPSNYKLLALSKTEKIKRQLQTVNKKRYLLVMALSANDSIRNVELKYL